MNGSFQASTDTNAHQAGFHPNAVIKLTREATWAQQHPTIMGPGNSYFYFGPQNAPGYIVYGNNRNSLPMLYFLRQRRDGSTYVARASLSP